MALVILLVGPTFGADNLRGELQSLDVLWSNVL